MDWLIKDPLLPLGVDVDAFDQESPSVVTHATRKSYHRN
jgi:hypothetical protein